MINLYHGDCLEVMKGIPDGSVDAIITDPPYGTTACKWDSVIPFEAMWEQLKRVIKPNGAIVLFGSEPFSSVLRMSNIKMYKYDWVWVKPQGVDPFMSKIRPLNNIENIIVFGGKIMYNPEMSSGKPYHIIRDKTNRVKETSGAIMRQTETVNNGTRLPTRTLYIKQERGIHPTQKPVALMEYLIKTYTNESETVLDFTMGSGTTGVACKNLSRKFIGIEKDLTYFNIAKDRINNTQIIPNTIEG